MRDKVQLMSEFFLKNSLFYYIYIFGMFSYLDFNLNYSLGYVHIFKCQKDNTTVLIKRGKNNELKEKILLTVKVKCGFLKV